MDKVINFMVCIFYIETKKLWIELNNLENFFFIVVDIMQTTWK